MNDPHRTKAMGSLSRRTWLLTTGASCIGPAAALAQPGATRVALVIGNAAYADAPLLNPTRDAQAMSASLRSLGFQVIEERDADRDRMESALQRTAQALGGRDGVALFYYAGHGLQLDWRNYLVPLGVQLRSAADVERHCVDLQRVLAVFRGADTRTNILVLDACRDNPFSAGASGRPKGLAPMDAPPGTFYAYATAPGNVAEDGSAADANGLYTRFLLGEMGKPGARIEDVFKRVRLLVRQASKGRQIPWESTSLEEDFVFATGEKVQAPSVGDREREFETHRAAWQRIKDSTRTADFFEFLERFPSGPFTEMAQFALDRYARPAVVAQAPLALQHVPTLPAGEDRYRVGDAFEYVVTDHMNGGATSRAGPRVTAIEGSRVMFNGGQTILDQMGSVLRNNFGNKDPGVLVAPAHLSLGKRWRTAFTNTPLDGSAAERNFYDCHVAALEDIELPAGKFRAYRIERLGQSVRWNGGSRLQATDWVDPRTMWWVKRHVRFTELNRGTLEVHQTFELASFRRAPR